MLVDAMLTGKDPEKDEGEHDIHNPVTVDDHLLKSFRILCRYAFQSDKLIDVMIRRDSRLAMKPAVLWLHCLIATLEMYNIFQSFLHG